MQVKDATTDTQEAAMSLREQLGTLPIYVLAFLYVSAYKARWLWVVFFMFCVLVPFIIAEHPYISILLILGGFGCIVAVTLPNRMLRRTPESQDEASVLDPETAEAHR